MSDAVPRIFLVDDDDDVRQALGRRLRAAGYALEAFASARAFLDRPPHDGPACVVLDLRMPEVDGLQLQEALAAVRSTMPVIFLTGHGDVPSTVAAMRRGATDVLLKPVEDGQLLEAITRALGSHTAARAGAAVQAGLRRRWERLTPRERQVCALVARGLLNKQIAAELACAEHTVKIHRARVMRKLAVDSVPALVRLFDQVGSA